MKEDDELDEELEEREEELPEEEDTDQPVDEDAIDPDSLGKYDRLVAEGENKYKLSGMYRDWFLDYASYVILDRAVPHIEDGLKPVQRRILHAMQKVEDGHYHKVAGIVGDTMKYHPHGDASIKDALVGLGQKEYLIDTQGNWGNIFTGDAAAASRYIEARLSKFALEVAFNKKITEWVPSYDGTNQEPVVLPMKFPLLLAQGTDGIAVGLSVKILPHNFNELLDACVATLRGKDFELYPDFPTGGLIDCSRYNRGLRGGKVKIRARIVKTDKRTLTITEIPFGQTTESLIDSIDVTAGLKTDGAIIVNTQRDKAEVEAQIRQKGFNGRVYTIDARHISIQTLGRYFPNSPMLAAIVKVSGFIDEDVFLEKMEASFRHKFAKKPEVIDGNMEALRMALRELK